MLVNIVDLPLKSQAYILKSITWAMLTSIHFFLSFQNPYIEMAHTYSTGKVADLEAFVNANADKFESVGSFSYSSFIWSIWHWI
jgi:hypothetical protein